MEKKENQVFVRYITQAILCLEKRLKDVIEKGESAFLGMQENY